MIFKIVPRLSYISAVSVSASLYFHEPRINLSTLSFDPLTASEKVEALPLPQNLKKKLLCLLQPVSEDIQAFLEGFWSLLGGHYNFHEKLSWTYLGTIDYGKSADNFASSCDWDNFQAFKLACRGSNPENIYRLWPKVRKDAREDISWRRNELEVLPKHFWWLRFWVKHISNEGTFRFMIIMGIANQQEKQPVDVTMLRRAMLRDNVGAAGYFLDDRLMPHILNLANYYMIGERKFDPTTFVFLVNHLSEEDSKAFLNLYSIDCLLRCLTWPLLQFFQPLSELVWPGFNFERNIKTLLQSVLMKIKQTQAPASYENIFETLWVKTPPQYRLMFITNVIYHILSNLFLGYDLQLVIAEIAKEGQENRIQLLDLFMENADVVMSLSVEDNKYIAFKTILEKYFADKLVENFEDCYNIFTQDYVNAYYGENISSDNSLSDDLMSDDFTSDDLSDND